MDSLKRMPLVQAVAGMQKKNRPSVHSIAGQGENFTAKIQGFHWKYYKSYSMSCFCFQ
jgi:hypothetical protein